MTLARQGAGLLQTYRYIVHDDLTAGRMLEVLPESGGRSRPFSLLYPNREAIVWHGGEAAASRGKFEAMPKEDREAMIAFLSSL